MGKSSSYHPERRYLDLLPPSVREVNQKFSFHISSQEGELIGSPSWLGLIKISAN